MVITVNFLNLFDCFQFLFNLKTAAFFVLLQSEEAPIDDLMELVQQIVAFHMKVQYSFYSKKIVHSME